MNKASIQITYVPLAALRPNEYNPKRLSAEVAKALQESVEKFGQVDPLILNAAPARRNVIIGGHQRYAIYKKMGMRTAPCVYLNIPDIEREKELCLRLSKNVAEFDWDLLADFNEEFLKNVGFGSEELDEIFRVGDEPERFDLEAELKKLDIRHIEVKKGDVWQLGPHRLGCGDSTVAADMLWLMGGEKADMCFTDPPYILDYLRGRKKKGTATTGFGLKRDRRYLETESLPENFSDLWMANVAKVQKPDFSVMVFEHPKNLRTIWNAMEKQGWRYRNTITWHVPNRVQGFAAKYMFFNKQDVALVGTGGNVVQNLDTEDTELFQNTYENAVYATAGRPQFEGYEKGKRICPTDFVECAAADEKSSGQSVIFGTKPIELLVPYIKVLTRRGDLVIDPFLGSGSTLVAAHKLGRRCYGMEKSTVYAEIIKRRWIKLGGEKPVLLRRNA